MRPASQVAAFLRHADSGLGAAGSTGSFLGKNTANAAPLVRIFRHQSVAVDRSAFSFRLPLDEGDSGIYR